MVFDGILASFIIGFFRKGKLDGFVDLKFKYGWVFPLLLAIQLIVFLNQTNSSFVEAISGYVYIAVYIIGLIFLWLNRGFTGMNLIFIGVLLNFLVMVLNGGRMPVSLEAVSMLDPAAVQILTEGLHAKHTAFTDQTMLGFLGDIIPLAYPYPMQQVISIGDILMNIGIFIFIQKIMMGHPSPEKTSETVEGGVQHAKI